MKKILIAFVGLIVILAVAVVVVPRLIDWNGYKPDIVKAVKDATGRDLEIAGDIDVSILPDISFEVSGIRLANAEGAAESDMVAVQSVRGRLALFPLVSREVIVEELVVTKPVVHLEVDADGRPNWAMSGQEEPEETVQADGGLPFSDLKLGDVRVEDGLITYHARRTGQAVVAKALTVKARLEGLASPFSLDGSVTVNDEPVTLKVSMDSPAGLLAGERASLLTALESTHITMTYDGGTRQKPVPALDGTFDLNIPSVGRFAAWLGRPLADEQPDPGRLDVHAVFAGEGAKMVLKEATIDGEALEAKADGIVDMTGATKLVTLNIEAGVLDVDRYLPPRGETPMARRRHDKDGPKEDARDPFQGLSDEPFDLSPLKGTDADVKIVIGGIKALGYEVGRIAFDATLKNGALTAKLAELGLYGGNMTADLNVDGSGEVLSVDVAKSIDNVDVGALARVAQGDQAKIAGIASGTMTAKGSGASPRALAQDLTAAAKLSLGGIDVKDAPGVISKLDLAIDLPGFEANPTVKGSVIYNKETVAFSLESDPVPTVLSEDRFAAKLALDSKRITVSYDGAVQRAPVPGMDGLFTLDVPSVGSLLSWLGQPLPSGQPDPGPLTVKAVLAADGATAILKEATIAGQALDAKASGSYDSSGEIPKLTFNVEAGVLDIDRYLPVAAEGPDVQQQPAPEKPAMAGAGPLAALPDEPFDLTPLRGKEAEISVSIGGLKAMGYALGRTVFVADLKGGIMNADLKELGLYGGKVAGKVQLDGSGEALGVDTAINMTKVDVGALARAAQGDAAAVAGIASGSVKADGRGKNPRALAESLAANVDLKLGGIKAEQAGMAKLTEAELNLDMPGLDRPTSLEANVLYNKQRVSLDLVGAPPKQVFAGQAFDLDAKIVSEIVNAAYVGKVQSAPVPGLSGNFDLDIPSVAALAAWLDQPLDPAQPDPGPLKVKAVMSADGAKAAIKEASINGKALKASAQASVDISQPVTRFDANVEIIEADLNAYLPPGKEAQDAPAGAAAAPGPASWSEEPIDVSALRSAEGQVVVKVGKIRYGDLDVESGSATVAITAGVLKALVEQVQLAGGTINVDATVDGSQQAPSVDYKVAIANVQARPLLKSFAGTDRLSGTLNFETSGRTVGGSQKQMVGALNGQGSFIFKNGAIHGMNIAATLRDVKSLGLASSEEQKTDFAELSGTFTITDGVLENRDLKMLAPLVRLGGGGVVPMPPRTVDYTVEAKLVASMEGQGGQDALAGLPIPVAITGSWDDPSFEVDWKSVLSLAAQDPARLANMPSELRDMGSSLGIDLPIPDLGTGTGTGGVPGVGDVLQQIPGLPGTQQAPAAPTGQTQPSAGVGGVLQQLIQPQATPSPAPAPAPAPAPTAPAPQQQAPALDPLNTLKKGLFGN